MTSKGLTITEGAMPATFEELSGMAKAFIASGMFKDVTAISQAIVKVQAGKELGIPPVYAMQNINMIKGKLCTSANTMALLIKRSGRYNYRITEHTDLVCNIKFLELEDNKWVEVGESKFTMEDAKRAKLVYPDSAWVKYPRAMLFSRAISQGARLYTPDAIGGVYTSEEIKAFDGPVGDEPEPITVTEEPQAEPAAKKPPPTAEQIAQAEKNAKELWPKNPPNAEAASQAAHEAAEQGMTVIGQADPFPPGTPGMRLKVRETGKIMEYQETTDQGGQWRTVDNEPPPEVKAPLPDAPTTLTEFFKWLQTKGKKFGSTWFYKAFSEYTPSSMKDAAVVAKAYAEVKEIQGW